MLITLLLFTTVATSTALFFSVRRNFQLLDIIENAGDNLEDSLKELNYYYDKVNKTSKMELFLDEPVTRELVNDIKQVKKTIKAAAEKISIFIEEDQDEKEE